MRGHCRRAAGVNAEARERVEASAQSVDAGEYRLTMFDAGWT